MSWDAVTELPASYFLNIYCYHLECEEIQRMQLEKYKSSGKWK